MMRTVNQKFAFHLFPAETRQTLLTHQDGPCVSIYMACQPASGDMRAAVFTLGQLLDRAESALVDCGMRRPAAQEMVQPGRELLTDPRAPFWQEQGEGLALFLAPAVDLHYRLPLSFTQQMVVGQDFYLQPLLPLLSGDGRFYVLAPSEKYVRLFHGTRFTVEEIALPHALHSLDEALRYDEIEKQLQQHSTTSSGLGRGQRAAALRMSKLACCLEAL